MKIIDLLESKSAPLYHATHDTYAADIIAGNKLEGMTEQVINGKRVMGVSLTRSLAFARQWGKIIFKLNQEKLAHRYKLVPIDYFQTNGEDNSKVKHFLGRRQGKFAEAEEFVIAPEIKNLDQYIDEIIITKETETRLRNELKANSMLVKAGDGMLHPQTPIDGINKILNSPKLKVV